MKTVSYPLTIEALEGRILFAASVPGTVDLTIVRVAAPTAPIEVSHHHVEGQFAAARVQNLAASPIKTKFTIEFYLSASKTPDSGDVLVGRAVAHPSLRAGASKGFIGNLQPNPDVAEGKYYLFAVLKPSPGVVNSNQTGDVAMAAGRVSIVRAHDKHSNDNSEDSGSDDSYCGPDTSDTATSVGDDSSPQTQPAGEGQATTQPAADAPSAPATQPSDTQPATQPSDTQPTTQPDPQPTTDPASDDPAPSAPASDSPSGDDSSSVDSGTVADDSSDF